MKILVVILGIAVAVAGAGSSYYNRTLYIQAAFYSEGYTLSAIPRLRVEEYYQKNRRFPQDNEQAELPPPHAIYGTGIKHIAVVRDGVIVVQFNEDSHSRTMVYTPRVDLDTGAVHWECASDSIDEAVMARLRPGCVYTPATAESELMRGIAEGRPEVVREKLQAGVDLEVLINGNTPLMLAARVGDLAMVEMLLDAGASVDHAYVNLERRTPLMIAVASQHAAVASLLLSRGADVERRDYSNRSALDYARQSDARNGDERFELMLAAQANPRFAARLLEADAGPSAREQLENDRRSYLRLKRAMGSCYVRQVETLLLRNKDYQRGPALSEQLPAGLSSQADCQQQLEAYVSGTATWRRIAHSALRLYIEECEVNSVHSVLLENLSLRLQEAGDGESVIALALRSGCTDVLNSLLRHPSVSRPLSSQLLTDAIRLTPQHSLLRTVSILIGEGADLATTDSKGVSPLSAAIDHEQPVVAKYLLDAGAPLSRVSATGSYPLIDATKKGYHHLAEQLIAAGADVNSRDRHGRTALHAAVANGHKRTVELLIQAGADPRIQDIDGVDSIVMAGSKRRPSIKAALLP